MASSIVTTIIFILSTIICPTRAEDSCPFENDCNICGPSPLNIISDQVKVVNLPPIRQTYNYSSTGYLTNTGVTVRAYSPDNKLANISGGPFCDDTYIYYLTEYYFTNCTDEISGDAINGNGTKLMINVVFFNTLYETFEKALGYFNGIAMVSYFVLITNTDNPKYGDMKQSIQEVAEPGCSVDITNGPFFDWRYLPPYSEDFFYYFYKGEYSEQGAGGANTCSYCATIVVPDFNSSAFNMSQADFDNSFGLLKNEAGRPLTFTPPLYSSRGREVFAAKGKINIFL